MNKVQYGDTVVFGDWSEEGDIWVTGTYGNGSEMESIVDNEFGGKREAVKSILKWAERVGAQVDEIIFD